MKRYLLLTLACIALCAIAHDVRGRGFGGFHSYGGFGGYRSYGGFGGYRGYSGGYNRSSLGDSGHSFSSFRGAGRYGGSYAGYPSGSAYSGWGGRAATGSYDHTWTDAAGGSITRSGTRGIAEGRYGGVAAGGTRDTTVTTAGGRTYNVDRDRGVVSGPLGRTVGGATGTVEGPRGTESWERAFSGNRYTGNMSHYASVYRANGVHSTAYWSGGYMRTRGYYVRHNFGYWGCFYPSWFAVHPGCWVVPAWPVGFYWMPITWPVFAPFFWGIPVVDPINYDYGSTVVYQGPNVYINGQDAGTATQFADQATTLTEQGQPANAP